MIVRDATGDDHVARLEDWRRSVVRVCDGRGFVVETEREGRFIITAAKPTAPTTKPRLVHAAVR